MLHFHIYAKPSELDILEKQLDKYELLCIKSDRLIVTEHTDEVINVVADFIIKYLYKNYVKNSLGLKYAYFNADEREMICNQVIFAFDGENLTDTLKTMYFDINLHSFVLFMMADDLKILDGEIDKACELMHARREYFDYIRLLKYYADMNDTEYDTVNVIFGKYGFSVTDAGFREITQSEADAEIALLDEDNSLVAALISLSPNKIIVHGADNADGLVIDTIVNVFGDKIYMCGGCPHCTRG